MECTDRGKKEESESFAAIVMHALHWVMTSGLALTGHLMRAGRLSNFADEHSVPPSFPHGQLSEATQTRLQVDPVTTVCTFFLVPTRSSSVHGLYLLSLAPTSTTSTCHKLELCARTLVLALQSYSRMTLHSNTLGQLRMDEKRRRGECGLKQLVEHSCKPVCVGTVHGSRECVISRLPQKKSRSEEQDAARVILIER